MARARPETRFFRRPEAFESLKRALRPRASQCRANRPLRAWVAGCAAGEDAYSLAVCLLEALGPRWREVPVRVFGAERRPELLAAARSGRYPAEAARGISASRLARYFLHGPDGLRVRPLLREACLFVDQPVDRPFSRLDAVLWRGAFPDAAALRACRDALSPGGFLLVERPASRGSLGGLFERAGSATLLKALPGPAGRPAPEEGSWRLLLRQVDDAVLVRDAQSDAILEANGSAARLFGWSVGELLTMRAGELLAGASTRRAPAAERRSPSRPVLPRYRRKDGTTFPAQAQNAFLMLRGRPSSMLVVRDAGPALREGSKRKESEARVQDVAHDLRGPAAAIQGLAQALRAGVRRRATRAEFLGSIERQAVRLTGMAERLLAPAAAASSTVALGDVARELVDGVLPSARLRRIKVSIDIPDGLTVRADPYAVPHILGNLLDNALKFNRRGGSVRISARVRGHDAVLSVADSGPGIASQDLARIFQRLFRADPTRHVPGSGLGLAIVLRIVEENRGRVWAESVPGQGTTFFLEFPE